MRGLSSLDLREAGCDLGFGCSDSEPLDDTDDELDAVGDIDRLVASVQTLAV